MIGNQVSAWRQKRENGKGISKAHLARRLGVSRSYITKLEQGKLQPSAEVMFRTAEYFGCKIEDVFQRLENEGTS